MAKKYDDDDDDGDMPVKKNEPLSGMNAMFANTNIVILIIFSLCCNWLCFLPLILSIVGVITCTDDKAKSNARICLIISGIVVVLGTISSIVQQMTGGGAGMQFK